MIKLGRGISGVRQDRAAKAAAGKATQHRLTLLAANIAPETPAVNVEATPTMPPAPLTTGAGADFETGDADPFAPDEDTDIVPEDTGGAVPELPGP